MSQFLFCKILVYIPSIPSYSGLLWPESVSSMAPEIVYKNVCFSLVYFNEMHACLAQANLSGRQCLNRSQSCGICTTITLLYITSSKPKTWNVHFISYHKSYIHITLLYITSSTLKNLKCPFYKLSQKLHTHIYIYINNTSTIWLLRFLNSLCSVCSERNIS